MAPEVWADSSPSGLRSGDCASSSPTPTGAAATQLVTELHDRGRRAVFVDTDAADAEAVEQLMTRAADLGTLRVLVNNAGGWLPGPQYPEGRAWRRSMDLNLVMPMLAAQLAVLVPSAYGGFIAQWAGAVDWLKDHQTITLETAKQAFLENQPATPIDRFRQRRVGAENARAVTLLDARTIMWAFELAGLLLAAALVVTAF